jgi:integrase
MRTKKPTYQKKDGSFERSIVVGHDDDGAPIRAFARGRTKSEMNEVYREISAQVQRSEYIVDKKTTVNQWSERWFKATQNPARIATYAMYEGVIRNHIIPRIGNLKLCEISEMDIKSLRNSMEQAGLTRTIQQTLMTLDQMFSDAEKDRQMRRNVAEDIGHTYIKQPKRPITAQEWDALEYANLDIRDRLIALLPLYASLRKEEVLALQAGDYQNHRITISRAWTKTQSGAGAIKDYPKSRAGFRTIVCPDPLDKIMQEAIKDKQPNDLLICRKNGGLFDNKYFNIRWEVIKKKANVFLGGRNGPGPGRFKVPPQPVYKMNMGIKYHELRHTFATCAYYAGIDIKRLQYLMGHEQSKTTLDTYTHIEHSHFDNPYPRQADIFKQSFTVNLRLIPNIGSPSSALP